MKRLFSMCCLAVLTLMLGNIITASAADLSEAQLVATRGYVQPGQVCFVTVLGDVCVPTVDGANLPSHKNIEHANCLVATGASMKLNNPNDPAQGFDPQTFNYFGRTTCNRPVPNLNDQTLPTGQQVRFIGGGGAITMSGKAQLLKITDPFNYVCSPLLATADPDDVECSGGNTFIASGNSYLETDNWALSRGEYLRSFNSNNLADTFAVVYQSRLELPAGWIWVGAGSGCQGQLTRVATCTQTSAPFQIGPNPGEPQGQP